MSADTGRDDSSTGTQSDEDDDDALTWGASSDKSYVEGPIAPTASDGPGDDADPIDDEDELPEGVLGSTMLVVHGVFAAVFLLYTVAWLISVGRATPPSVTGVSLALWHVGQYLAFIAPPLWFVTTIVMSRVTPARGRIAWLLISASSKAWRPSARTWLQL